MRLFVYSDLPAAARDLLRQALPADVQPTFRTGLPADQQARAWHEAEGLLGNPPPTGWRGAAHPPCSCGSSIRRVSTAIRACRWRGR